VRPVRVLGRDAEITGQTVTAYLNQVYGEQEKYVLLEVEVPAGADGTRRTVADVTVTYSNMASKATDTIRRSAAASFATSPAQVDANTNRVVMASAIEQIAVERNLLAISLRDQGRIEEARRVLRENAAFLADNARRYESKALEDYSASQVATAEKLDEEDWNATRKANSSDTGSRIRRQSNQ
jgi:Ca-activated chloride channel family protein